ncbi:CL12B-like protein, partial [Mya arenaria]
MYLSSLSESVFDPPVLVSCDLGFYLDTNVNVKNITCIFNGSSAVWDDVVGTCLIKQCPSILTVVGANMSTMDPDIPYEYGANITMDCDPDFAFKLDFKKTILWKRIQDSAVYGCDDDNVSISGVWTNQGNCSEIVCNGASVGNATQVFSDPVIHLPGTTTDVECFAGHYLADGIFSVTATCNENAFWNTSTTTSLDAMGKCKRDERYAGCLSPGAVVPLATQTSASNCGTECRQFCLPLGTRYASVLGSTCTCGDDLAPGWTTKANANCDLVCPGYTGPQSMAEKFCGGVGGQEAVFALLGFSFVVYTDRGTDLPVYSSCQLLFENGVKEHGYYYLNSPLRKDYCNFYDGTVCELGWYGFVGHCYYFHTDAILSWSDGRDACRERNAEMTSVTSLAEKDFLMNTREKYPDLWADSKSPFWVGLVDDQSTVTYTWMDGNVNTFSNFYSAPYDPLMQCAFEQKHNASAFSYKWDQTKCTSGKFNAMCKKPAGDTPPCGIFPNLPLPLKSLTDAMMTRTYCSQFCKGQQITMALLQGTSCLCYDLLPPHTPYNTTDCSTLCPGSTFQYCGGPSVDQYSVLNGCEYGWVHLDGHCYRYQLMCDKEGQTRSAYSNKTSWRIGYSALSLNNGMLRWSNGRADDPFNWNPGPMGRAGPSVFVQKDNYDTLYSEKLNFCQSYICEKAPDYVGCFTGTGVTMEITNYNRMTIQQCVETCRGVNKRYAFLGTNRCGCDTSLVGYPAKYGLCKSPCPGQKMSVCGGAGDDMSVYDTDMYPEFAMTCMDLFKAGVFLNGTYVVNTMLETCNFVDGGDCGGDGWISIVGSCYKHFLNVGGQTKGQICRNQGALPTSLITRYEYNVIAEYIRQLELDGQPAMVFSGLNSGAYSAGVAELLVLVSADGHLTDLGLILENTNIRNTDVIQPAYQYYAMLRVDTAHVLSWDGGVICKTDICILTNACMELQGYHVVPYATPPMINRHGCYQKPPTMPATLSNYGAMELTLCRQLCIGKSRPIFAMGADTCTCGGFDVLNNLTLASAAECNIPCTMHPDQMCGNGSVIWVYDTDETRCPGGWFGKEGLCFKFYRSLRSIADTRAECAARNSYIFNPWHPNIHTFINQVISESGVLASVENIWTGIRSATHGLLYTASNGRLLSDAQVVPGDIPASPFVYNVTLSKWKTATSTSNRHICQTDQADWDGLTGTCSDAWRAGITESGMYAIRNSITSTYITFKCFAEGLPIDVTASNVSSEIAPFTKTSVLFSQGFVEAWKPYYFTTAQFVTLALPEEYLIRDIIIKGILSSTELIYVTGYRLEYLDTLQGHTLPYVTSDGTTTLTGCPDRATLCPAVLDNPFITTQVSIWPQTWIGGIAFQVTLHGDLYPSYNHDARYVDCMADYGGSMFDAGLAATVPECIELCAGISQPYASLDRKCPPPDQNAVENGTLLVVTHPYQSGIYTYKTSVTYRCNTGYELPDWSTEQTLNCQQNNIWEPVTNCS